MEGELGLTPTDRGGWGGGRTQSGREGCRGRDLRRVDRVPKTLWRRCEGPGASLRPSMSTLRSVGRKYRTPGLARAAVDLATTAGEAEVFGQRYTRGYRRQEPIHGREREAQRPISASAVKRSATVYLHQGLASHDRGAVSYQDLADKAREGRGDGLHEAHVHDVAEHLSLGDRALHFDERWTTKGIRRPELTARRRRHPLLLKWIWGLRHLTLPKRHYQRRDSWSTRGLGRAQPQARGPKDPTPNAENWLTTKPRRHAPRTRRTTRRNERTRSP